MRINVLNVGHNKENKYVCILLVHTTDWLVHTKH